MIPMSTSSSQDIRLRKAHPQRKALVRSNSSLLGSIKNFVAAPFARLFTGNADDFDDSDDLSGKRRRIVNSAVDNNDIVEDGPAPAKRMRVRSPDPSPPPRSASAAYLDPPSSAFQQNHNHYLLNNQPGRSASISLPPTTLSDSSARNTRSTLSPLRTHFSRNMSIDSLPAQNSRPATRDVLMKSIPVVSTLDNDISMRLTSLLPSRDHSMPPTTGRPSFRMRSSLTPQPYRDASEPPPLTALKTNPIFVRGPSHAPEPQPKPMATLGSLVEAQRNVRSPTRQRTLLFRPSPSEVDPQAVAAERALHELEFYKTPLVPTRLRSKMSNGLAATVSASNITDMFSRKHPLILMGDHDRPSRSKRDKKNKEKVKEHNETKPYAGTTGIKKRLAKAKGAEDEEINEVEKNGDDAVVDDVVPTVEGKKVATEPFPEVPLPLPPFKEKDTFNVAAFPSTSKTPSQSSLRVGRAARSHLSRPAKKFSAVYDEEQDLVSDETKKDMEMLEEAAKKVPVFEIPAGFSFAKDTKPIEHDTTNAKEPPIASLPFSLSKPSGLVPPTKSTPTFAPTESGVKATAASSLFGHVSGSTAASSDSGSLFGAPSAQPPSVVQHKPLTPPEETPDTGSKMPNFFASSKVLASQPAAPPSSVPGFSLAPPSAPPSSFTPSFATPTKDSENPLWECEKRKEETLHTSSVVPKDASTSGSSATSFSLVGQGSVSSPFPPSALAPSPPTESAQKGDTQPSLFTFGGHSQVAAETKSVSSLFSFDKPVDTPQPQSTSRHPATTTPFGLGSTSATDAASKADTPPSFGNSSAGTAPKAASPFNFTTSSESSAPVDAAPKATPFSFSNTSAGGAPADAASKAASPFSFSSAPSAPADTAPKSSTPFSFGPSSSTPTPNLFGSSNEASKAIAPNPAPFSFGQPSMSDSSSTAPKSLFGTSNSNVEAPKPSFGNGSLGPSFSFGQSKNSEQPKSPFSAPTSASSESGNKSPFTFGPSTPAPTASTSSPFTFGTGTTNTNDASKPFTFGGSNPVRPVTPPNQVQEVRMEESPTRDVQVNKPAEPRPSISGFSFNPSPSVFGQNGSSTTPASTGFSFGQSSGTSNPFGGMKTDDKAENKSFGSAGGFGQSNTSSSPFSFGRPQTSDDPPRPSTTGSFTFGVSSTPAPATNSPFAFGAPPNNNTTANAFGQPSGGSAPNSPSTFGQISSFSFAATPAPSSGNPFAFGSQPASPATPSTTLPQSSGVGGFGSAGAPAFGAPSSGFGGGNAGGNLFTIGSAPTNTENRQIKKMPTRRKR